MEALGRLSGWSMKLFIDRSERGTLIAIMCICLAYLFLFIPEYYFYNCRDIDKYVEDLTTSTQGNRDAIKPYLRAIASYKERYNVILVYFAVQNIIIILLILFVKRDNKT